MSVPNFIGLLLVGAAVVQADPVGTTVGFPARVEVFVAGTEIEVVPVTDRACPVALRIVSVVEGAGGRTYDLEAQGLEPGRYDLRNFLRRRDGSSMEGVAPVVLEVGSALPADRFEPAEAKPGPLPPMGGYRFLVAGAGALWLIGLCVIWVTRPMKHDPGAGGVRTEATIADELKALVARVEADQANPAHLADIERAVIAYWTRRMRLAHLRPVEALRAIRGGRESGAMLAHMEERLHRPAVAAGSGSGVPEWVEMLGDLPPEEERPR